MSRYRASTDDLAYGEIPQRWDRDRFERFSRQPARHEEDYRFAEKDRTDRRVIAVADRVEERGPNNQSDERDQFIEREWRGSGRPRRRTDRELFGDVDPRELAEMSLTPFRRQSVSREEVDISRRSSSRPGILRRQSSLDTFDRRKSRQADRGDYRIPPYKQVPLPIRRRDDFEEEEFEDVRFRDHDPEDYREVEIRRERSVHRRRPKSTIISKAESEAASIKSKAKTASIAAPSHVSSSSESSTSSSESFEEVTKEESIHETISDTQRKFKKGKTRMPKRLVRREAIMDLGHPFDEEESFFVLRIALEKDQIDEVIRISETYKNGAKREKAVYRFEEDVADRNTQLKGEREEIVRTEWLNPPTISGRSERSRSIRATSPSARSANTRVASKSRARSRAASISETVVEDNRTTIESSPNPAAVPLERSSSEFFEERKTVIEERSSGPPKSLHDALVLQEREHRSDHDIQAEIRALEAERRALRLEREADEKRDHALRLRTRPDEEFQLVEYQERRPREREVLEIVERQRSPSRNVIRVEKDRKGRMALVRSAH